MAVSGRRAVMVRVPAAEPNDDLTDQQIEDLLARAAERLKAKSGDKIAKTGSSGYSIPRLETGELVKPYTANENGVATADSARFVDERQRKLALGFRKVEDPIAAKELAAEKKKASAGRDWFDLPRTDLTPELKRDLQLIKMRGILDPHRHYKKDNGKMKAPEYSQVGTIMEGPTEFFSGRIENKKRKRTFVEEVLAGEQESGRFKKKFNELQSKKTSGKKAFYKAMKAKRRGGVGKGGNG